jgi:hypothetical protein
LVGLIKEARRTIAIFGDVNLGLDPRGFDRFPNQENVRRVILDDENVRPAGVRLRSLGA